VPVEDMHIPITGFGNLALPEVRRLSSMLRAAAPEWGAPPLLRFGGATALEWPEDRSVWLKLQGEVEELTGVARSIPETVRKLGLFVDRRRFRPWLAVGSITPFTTGEYLEHLVAYLDGCQGPDWRPSGISLLRMCWGTAGEPARPEELERFELVSC
jgi:2'-5' RNA ligase